MGVAVLAVLLLVVGVVVFVFWLLFLIEAVRIPRAQWDAAGQSQLIFVLLMAILGIVGTLIYIAVARSQVRGAPQNR